MKTLSIVRMSLVSSVSTQARSQGWRELFWESDLVGVTVLILLHCNHYAVRCGGSLRPLADDIVWFNAMTRDDEYI